MRTQRCFLLYLGLAAAAAAAPAQTPPGLSAASGALLARALGALAAGPQAGFIARGTAVLNGPRGAESGDITVEVWGASHCRMTLDFSRPGQPRRYVAVMDGKRTRVTAPRDLIGAAAAPNWRHGCALLPQGTLLADLASGAAAAQSGASDPIIAAYRPQPGPAAPAQPLTLTLDAGTALPASAAWNATPSAPESAAATPTPVSLAYSGYREADGVQYPTQVTESVGGATRLTVQFQSLTPRTGYTEADFALPKPPAPPTHGSGGPQ